MRVIQRLITASVLTVFLGGLGLLIPLPKATLAQTSDPVLVGAGDISACNQDKDEATAQLLDRIAGTVFTLGDNTYPDGTLDQFINCYGPTWGRHKDRTRPSLGNHDYHTLGASGHYTYFGSAASPLDNNCTSNCKGYYSYDLGAWHIVVLNSEIDHSAGSVQEQWLRADLAANPSACTLAYWHKPRFTSGTHGNNTSFHPFWQALYEYGADVVLNGHDHTYERFAPQSPTGQADPARGIREFVVGTGGAGLYSFPTIQPNSEVRENTTWGVLKLTLHATSYDWEFVPIAGQTFTDAGSGNCVSPASTATPAPLGWIFADGFESGSFSAWTSANTGGGDLQVNPSAALAGTQGMQVLINDTTNIYVTDESPNIEPYYRARFYFDPNGIDMADGNAHYIFNGYDASALFQVEFRFSAGNYQIRMRQNNDANSVSSTGFITISDAPHLVELEWQAATASGANNGGVNFWVDGVLSGSITGVDNDTRRIDRVSLGAVTGIDTRTTGSYFIDAFESYRQSSPTNPTSTSSVTTTATPTSTPTPTYTTTPTATSTPTSSRTSTPSVTASPTITASRTNTPIATNTLTPTTISTTTPTQTLTPSATASPTVTASRTNTPIPTATSASTIISQVTASSDDAEETANSGSMDLVSSDLEIGTDAGVNQWVGMRFNNIAIPRNATILSASVEFEVDETGSEATSVTIHGQAVDNASTFTTIKNNISSRTRTTAQVAWNNIPSWTTVNAKVQTPNLSAIIQEIVNRPGWASGNSIVIIINGTGRRTAEAYNGEIPAAPRLLITYVIPAPTATATATATKTATSTLTPISTATPTRTATLTGTATASRTPTPTATTPADLIFADGFESGSFSAWTSTSIGGGDLRVGPSAALVGSQGMQVVINDTANIYVTDESPNAERRYRARFYFDPNGITMTGGNTHYIFTGADTLPVFQVEFRFYAGNYQVRVRQYNDSNAVLSTSFVTISDASHILELEWWAATATGANNGGINFWVDGVPNGGIIGVDNDTRRIDRATLGAVSGLDSGTLGTYFLDAFESRRQSYIGP